MPLIFAFDLDGTLLDNVRLKAQPFLREMVKFGVDRDLALNRFLLGVGLPHRTVARQLFAECGKKVPEAALLKASDRIKKQWERDVLKFKLMPGARRTLEALKADGHVIVMSSSAYPGEIKAILKRKRIRKLFDGVFGYSDRNPKFIKGQVHNEMARRIAEKKGVRRNAKLVYIGDGLFDMQKTRATRGAIAVGITGTVSREHLFKAGAHHVVENLTELIPLSRTLERKRR
ncbi:MAG: HAD family hydrolase [Candidatus Micrarchaeota archaeon]